MNGELETVETPLRVTPLRPRRFALEVALGILITLGLAALWACENVRNMFFHLLDRLRLKLRPRAASAFPPGRPRKLKQHSMKLSTADGNLEGDSV